MGKKNKKRRSQNAFNIVRKLSPFAAAAGWIMKFGFSKEAGMNILRSYTGYSLWSNKMEWGRLVEGYGPSIAVEAALKVKAAIGRLIRSVS